MGSHRVACCRHGLASVDGAVSCKARGRRPERARSVANFGRTWQRRAPLHIHCIRVSDVWAPRLGRAIAVGGLDRRRACGDRDVGSSLLQFEGCCLDGSRVLVNTNRFFSGPFHAGRCGHNRNSHSYVRFPIFWLRWLAAQKRRSLDCNAPHVDNSGRAGLRAGRDVARTAACGSRSICRGRDYRRGHGSKAAMQSKLSGN